MPRQRTHTRSTKTPKSASRSAATRSKTKSTVKKCPPQSLADLANIGPALLKDFAVLGIKSVEQLAKREAFELWRELCKRTGQRHDLCVIDVFMSAVAQANGEAPCPWWHFTGQRKKMQAKQELKA